MMPAPSWFERTGWLLLLLVPLGCSGKGNQPVVIFGVEDRTAGTLGGLRLEEPLLYRRLEVALERSPVFRPVAGTGPEAWRAQAVVQATDEQELTEQKTPGLKRTLLLELSLWKKRPDGDESRLHAVGEAREIQPADRERQAGFQELLEKAMTRAVKLAEIELQAGAMTEAELAELLTSPDDGYRLQALRALRERRLARLAPRVVEMLRDPNPEVGLEAVGVLVAWKQQDAAVAIISSGQGKDILYQSQVITALGEIGGAVARGYLFTVAAGHLSPHLRGLAEEQLEKLRQADEHDDSGGTSGPTAEVRRGRAGNE